jgi:hypothetical protein
MYSTIHYTTLTHTRTHERSRLSHDCGACTLRCLQYKGPRWTLWTASMV